MDSAPGPLKLYKPVGFVVFIVEFVTFVPRELVEPP
jgi:hypothetical protein